MGELANAVTDLLDRTPEFTGAVRVDAAGETIVAEARGFCDRANGVPNTPETRFAVASVTKTFTALTVVSLIVDGVLSLDTTARSLLGDDLPLIHDEVTVGQLLSHRSGIGDYLDEEQQDDITEYAMTSPVHRLHSPESFLAELDGFPQVFEPGTAFAYNNGGFVVLALLAERAAGRPYVDLVRERVIASAGLVDTDFLRSDERPADVAIGYLYADGLRSNVLHMPLVGVGDGGLTSSTADLHRVWAALRSGGIVPPEWADRVTTSAGPTEENGFGYGFGVFVRPTGAAQMEGYDAGISARSIDDLAADMRWTVISNWSEGMLPIAQAITRWVADGVRT